MDDLTPPHWGAAPVTNDPAEIAAKLTEAQRAKVLSLSGDWTTQPTSYAEPVVWLAPSILEQAIPPRMQTERLRLTPLGQAVRDHILKGAE